LCGLEIPAIARALFASEDAIEKRLVLARRRIRDGGLSFELPSPSELAERLDAVLHVLYLLFNEAYWGTSGPDIVQEDVAKEAIRLVSFVGEHPSTARPRVLALRSLMHFHASRFAARVDEDNNLVTLAGQDRSLWNRDQIDQGLRFLAASAQGEEVSAYHYEAAIAAVHATSLSHDRTDWARIVGFYDELCDLSPSPGARLSRAIAIGFRDGPVASLALLASLGADEVLRGLAPFHAARGEAHARLGEVASAHEAFLQARACSTNLHEQRYLDRRIARLLA
jgi:RNA polymerase sigma-70 factor (ECF subfamily)